MRSLGLLYSPRYTASVYAKTTSTSAVNVLAYTASNTGTATFSAGSLTLDGFFTSGQDQIFLQLRQTDGQEEVLGLLLATRLPE